MPVLDSIFFHIYTLLAFCWCVFCETNPIFPLPYIQTFLNVDCFGRGVSWVQIICARLTLSRPLHTPRLTGGAGHQLDGIRLHFSSKSQPIRGCFYAADNLAIGCKWKDGANALAPVRTAPKHQRLFSEKTLRMTLKDPGLLNLGHSLNQKSFLKIKFHHHTMLKIFAKKTTTFETCCELPHNKLTSAPNPWVARLVFSTNRITSDCFGLAEGEK